MHLRGQITAPTERNLVWSDAASGNFNHFYITI